jgi:hypothetical protein
MAHDDWLLRCTAIGYYGTVIDYYGVQRLAIMAHDDWLS